MGIIVHKYPLFFRAYIGISHRGPMLDSGYVQLSPECCLFLFVVRSGLVVGWVFEKNTCAIERIYNKNKIWATYHKCINP